MSYRFELSFTGLCILTFKGDKRKPEQVNVLLVDTRHHEHGGAKAGPDPDLHLPFLSYDVRDIDKGQENNPIPPHRLVPGPDGSQIALQSLVDRKNLQIELPVSPKLEAVWRPAEAAKLDIAPDKGKPEQEEWLDWVMALQRMNSETPSPTNAAPFAGLKEKIIARVSINQGTLKARGFLHLKNGDYAIWDFKVPPSGEIKTSHAMARDVVLSVSDIPNEKSIGITGDAFKVFLIPPLKPDGSVDSPLRASITNLPEAEDPEDATRVFLKHHLHFYDLVDFTPPPPKIRLPHKHTGVITSGTGFCPPTTHTKSE